MSGERYFRPAPGAEGAVIEALLVASKAKNAALIEALRCLRTMKALVDGVCWGNQDEAVLELLESTVKEFALSPVKLAKGKR